MTMSGVANERPMSRDVPDETNVDFLLALRDGTLVRVRPIRADDGERLRAFHARVSPDSIMFRYFRALPVLSEGMVEHLTHVDYATRMALVATLDAGDDEQIIAVVRYEGISAAAAEVAFLVEDRWQGHGIATALLHHLAAHARERGFTAFVAEVMDSNHRMREVLRMAGFPHTVRYESGCVEEYLDITAPPLATFGAANHY
jgi:GNAT superfamily N-acetyltransferase